MLADYHIHTCLCRHARGRPDEYLGAARQKGLPEIALTDHAPAPDGYDKVNRMDIARYPEYEAIVAGLTGSSTPPVLYGIEADYYEGGMPFLETWLRRQDFDVVLGSVHFIGDWGFDDPKNLKVWDTVDITQTWREYFRLVSRLADTRQFDIVGHLDLPKKFGHRPSDRDLKEIAQPALDRIAAAGMGIEINTGGLRKPVAEIYPSPLLLGLARERGIPISFGSDSHAPEEVGYAFDLALALARAAGYTDCLRLRKRQKSRVPLPPRPPGA